MENRRPDEAGVERGGNHDDEGGLPPFVRSWKAFYLLVIGNFLLLLLIFYGIQALFA